MKYHAITLDTNIFIENGLRLESGLIANLNQFYEGSAEFVISEIVIREILRHLIKKHRETAQYLNKKISEAIQYKIIPEELSSHAHIISENLRDAEDNSQRRIQSFFQNTKANVLAANKININI